MLHQGPHLPGHGENVGRKPHLAVPVIFFALQQLRIGHDDGKGRLQLVGGVGDKLALLLPSPLHRFHCPGGQFDADPQKSKKAEHADEDAVLDQIV